VRVGDALTGTVCASCGTQLTDSGPMVWDGQDCYRKKTQGRPHSQVSRGQEPCPTGVQDAQVLHGRIVTMLNKRVFPRDRGKVMQSFRHNWFRRMVEKGTALQLFLGVNARGFGVRQGTSSRSTHPHGLSAQPAACVRLILTSAGKDEVASSRAGTHNIRSTRVPRPRGRDTR